LILSAIASATNSFPLRLNARLLFRSIRTSGDINGGSFLFKLATLADIHHDVAISYVVDANYSELVKLQVSVIYKDKTEFRCNLNYAAAVDSGGPSI